MRVLPVNPYLCRQALGILSLNAGIRLSIVVFCFYNQFKNIVNHILLFIALLCHICIKYVRLYV